MFFQSSVLKFLVVVITKNKDVYGGPQRLHGKVDFKFRISGILFREMFWVCVTKKVII
jgi:hypothetical protein